MNETNNSKFELLCNMEETFFPYQEQKEQKLFGELTPLLNNAIEKQFVLTKDEVENIVCRALLLIKETKRQRVVNDELIRFFAAN